MRPNRRQVSWLAGPHPSPPSRTRPVALWLGLAAYSCGGSCGFGTPWFRTAFPFGSHLERPSMAVLKGQAGRLSTRLVTSLRLPGVVDPDDKLPESIGGERSHAL